MERESFEDQEAADALNRDFVAIKVDKEERPDVDSVYMSVCQALTGSGGWPLTIIMTPDQKPFFAGTYLPKRSKHGMQGLLELLETVVDLWKTDRASLIKSGNSIIRFLRENEKSDSDSDTNGAETDRKTVEQAVKSFAGSFDKRFGGFGGAPKFPTPHNLMFLLRYSAAAGDENALYMVEKTLQSMYRGGIFDHVGYGFARYSTDQKWLAPHFEKMLYDNALLVIAYLEAYQITKKPLYLEVAEKTLRYIFREMESPEGGFYSAQDADSEGVEGRFYLLSPDDIDGVIGSELGKRFRERFGITDKGNFEGLNIPNLIDNPEFETSDPKLDDILTQLQQYRSGRYRLHKDDKILTSWNALMIVALAKAYQITDEDIYLDKAKRAMKFIETNLTDENGNLYVSYREGRSAVLGFLDDYAFSAWAYLALYESTFSPEYLNECIRMSGKMSDLFEDVNGGFYLYGSESEMLISRPKETYDGAIPSGNSAVGYVLSRLADLTGNPAIAERADRQLAYLGSASAGYPSAHSFALMAAMNRVYPSAQLVCVLPNANDVNDIQCALRHKFFPNTSVVVKTPDNQEQLSAIAHFVRGHDTKDGKPTFYLCRNYACEAPVNSIEGILDKLK